MDTNNNTSSTFGQDMAYDLRQIYAKIVGEHMQDIAEARKANDYYAWFKNLQDLHTVIKHKFKEDKEEKKETKKSANEIYEALVNKLVSLANKYPQTFNGANKEPQSTAEIDQALRDIETFLYEKMNKASMFGSSGRIEGL